MKRPPNRGWNNLFQSVLGTACPQSAKRIAITAAVCLIFTTSSPAIIDTNANGLSDLWEKQHNNDELFPETFNPQADPDQDAWTNAEEAAAGTDPSDPNPPGGFLRPEILHTLAVLGEENGQPVIITPEAVTVSWPTLVGKQYTLQLSPDLSENWINIDEPLIGDGDIHEFNFTLEEAAERNFYRVAVTDVDTDKDGLTNAEENELNTDPDLTDTDGDGKTDGEEIEEDTNPNVSDTDVDGLDDNEDADPIDPLVDWPTTPAARYILIDVTTPSEGEPTDLNDNGDVLFPDGYWSGGTWHPLEVPDIAGSYPRDPGDQGDHEFVSETSGWTFFDEEERFVGTSSFRLSYTPDPGISGGGESLLESTVLLPGSMSGMDLAATFPLSLVKTMSNLSPVGIDGNGRAAAQLTYFTDVGSDPANPQLESRSFLVRYSPGSTNEEPAFLSPPDGRVLRAGGYVATNRVSPSGWVVVRTDNQEGESPAHGIALWSPNDTQWTLPEDARTTFFSHVDIAEMPNQRPAISASALGIDASVYLQKPTGEFEKSAKLSSQGLRFLAGDGTGMSHDHKMWRNGKKVALEDVSEAAKELIEDGWTLLPLQANKHGVYLIDAAGPQGEKATKLLVPVVVHDNTLAGFESKTGVDRMSLRAGKGDKGYQDHHWIMAPSGNVPPGFSGAGTACENDTLFHVPYRSASHLKINPTSSTVVSVNPFAIAPANLDQNDDSTWPKVTWRSNALTTVEDAVSWRLGTPPAPEAAWLEKDFPVKVKVMKNRIVKVAVYRVRRPGTRAFPVYDEEAKALISEQLYKVFATQINAWLKPDYFDVEIAYDTHGNPEDPQDVGPDGALIIETAEESALATNAALEDTDDSHHIKVIIVDDLKFATANFHKPGAENAYDAIGGHWITGTNTCIITQGVLDYDFNKELVLYDKDPRGLGHTMCHEIGHILVGLGHPDDPHPIHRGQASLDSLKSSDHFQRLMCSGRHSGLGSNLLVKKEWDLAEEWLSEAETRIPMAP